MEEERSYEEIQKDLLQKSNLELLRTSAHIQMGRIILPEAERANHFRSITNIALWSIFGRRGYRSYDGRIIRAIAESKKPIGPPKTHVKKAAESLVKGITKLHHTFRSIPPKEWEQRGFEPEEVREVHHYLNTVLATMALKAAIFTHNK